MHFNDKKFGLDFRFFLLLPHDNLSPMNHTLLFYNIMMS